MNQIGTASSSSEGAAPTVNPLSLDAVDRKLASAQVSSNRRKTGFFVDLDLKILSEKGFITPDDPRSQIAEEYRRIKRPLLKRALDRSLPADEHNNLILVTSALAGEGKTFTAINLAMSIVMEYDHTVLLIDADMIKPELSRIFNIREKSGLVEVLMESSVDLADVMVRTNIANLRVVGSGRPHPLSTEMLASYQMAALANNIAKRYPERIIIIDSSPLLATSQSSVLAHLVGQVVLVVESGRTPQTAVKEAVSHLDETKSVWMIMNKGKRPWGSSYYGKLSNNYNYS